MFTIAFVLTLAALAAAHKALVIYRQRRQEAYRSQVLILAFEHLHMGGARQRSQT